MRIAAFESEADATATATALRETGYDSRVVTRDDSAYQQSLEDFFRSKPRTYEPHAFVISESAQYEPFLRAVIWHYGFVIRGET